MLNDNGIQKLTIFYGEEPEPPLRSGAETLTFGTPKIRSFSANFYLGHSV